jgi:hypothetical protein
MLKIMKFTACLTVLLLLGACAKKEEPLGEQMPVMTTNSIVSVETWNELATVVAARVKKSVDDREDLEYLAIDVKQPRKGPFYNIFNELLQTRLVDKGLQVSSSDEGLLGLKYSIQVVEFEDGDAGEVVINTALVFRNRYVTRTSHVFFIAGEDAWRYERPSRRYREEGYSLDGEVFDERTVEVVNE